MSLINDALEKARSEADARAERERATGGPSADYRPPRAHLPRRSGWAPGLVIGVMLGAVLVGAIGLGWWLGRSGSESPPAAVHVAEAPTAQPPTSEAPIVPPAETPVPVEGPDGEAAGEAPTSAEPIAPTVTPEPAVEPAIEPAVEQATGQVDPAEPSGAIEPTEAVETATEPDIEAPATADATATDPEAEPTSTEPTSPRPTLIQPPNQVGHVADNVYVLEADLGGLTLELDFIVWGATPFAQINGRQVEVDQVVDGGFLVDAIDRQQVTLKHADGRVVVLRIR